ncbi:MAG: hypothetical protein WBC42_06980 [Candidatus Zixiibacteriota bacterium]
MNEVISRILGDAVLLGGLGGLLLYFLRKYINKAVEYHFSRFENEFKTKTELEKEKSKYLITERQAIYPDLVSLIYRLRNKYRDALGDMKQELQCHEMSVWSFAPSFGEDLYILTHNLYKYRVFIPGQTFELVHHFKRILQDVDVYADRVTRRDGSERENEDEAKSEWGNHLQYFEDTYREINELYPKIVKQIQDHMKGFTDDF